MQKMCAWLAAGLLATAGAAQSQPQPEITFYNLSDDPNSLSLLGLDAIDGPPTRRTTILVDLYRGKDRFGTINTWSFDCVHGRMRIIEAMMFAPGHPGQRKAVTGEVIPTNSNSRSRRMASLVCEGRGDLKRDHAYREELPAIISRFWGP